RRSSLVASVSSIFYESVNSSDWPVASIMVSVRFFLGNGNSSFFSIDLSGAYLKFEVLPDQAPDKSMLKKELLTFPRFTKLIIKHILSHHNTVSKRPQSDKHGIKLDAVLGNLKLVKKGEEHPRYGLAIPEEMMSDTIKASADYLNYLAKSMGTQTRKCCEKG
nr:hypothetical protein [Tanacetum cinerariifolium]